MTKYPLISKDFPHVITPFKQLIARCTEVFYFLKVYKHVLKLDKMFIIDS